MAHITTALEAKCRQLMSLPAVDLESPCTFECQGCGWHCCSDRDDLLLTPYSAVRIAWWLQDVAADYPEWKQPVYRPGASAMAMGQGASSHLPLAMLDFKPAGGHTYCPFLVAADDVEPSDGTPALVRALLAKDRTDQPLAVCGIYPVRPNACRLFPLGRIGEPGENDSIKWQYVLQDVRCGKRGQRADGLTWGEWIDPQEQARSAKGLQVYTTMVQTVYRCLADAGVVEPEVWLNDAQRQMVLASAIYGLPMAVDAPRERRTHETALAVCEASAGLLPQVVEALLRGIELDPEELVDTVQAAL